MRKRKEFKWPTLDQFCEFTDGMVSLKQGYAQFKELFEKMNPVEKENKGELGTEGIRGNGKVKFSEILNKDLF